MKTTHSKTRLLVPLFVATLVAAGSVTSACARETKSGDSRQGQRPPLRLNVDQAPINRNAPDRVSYAPVIEKSAPSTVFVYSTKQVRPEEMAPFLNDPVLRRFFGAPGGRVPEQTQRGLGSGVIVSADGYILTNNHVVEGADEVKVSIGDSLTRHDATLVGADALSDIAVLKIEAPNLAPATLGDSEQLKVGDVVLAMGNPFGVGMSVSRGIVSAVSRGVGIEQIEDFIQTDAAINMGNSGGPLIDSAGRVVGINTAILSRTGGFAGVGFAIPINMARNVAEQIINKGEVTRGFLGVAPQPLTPELAAQFGAQRGALLAEITPASPAEKAGLRAGDIITSINGKEIADPRQLLLSISQLPPGTSVKLDYVRDGRTRSANVTLERRPDQESAGAGRNGPSSRGDDGVLDGVSVTDLTPELRQQLQIPPRVQGVIVAQVEPTSPAAMQGLREGDVILELDRKPVRNAEEAVRLSEEIKGPRVTVRVFRDGQSRYMVIDESESEPVRRGLRR